MKITTKTTTTFFSILTIVVAGLLMATTSTTIPAAYAETTVSLPVGSAVPGCEETDACYIPGSVSIGVGDMVTWSNDDTAAHTVTSGTASGGPDGIFDSSLFAADTTFSHTFDEEGTFDYFCMVHPWMVGLITVEEQPVDPECSDGMVYNKETKQCEVEDDDHMGKDDMHTPDGDASATGMLSDGTMVSIWTSEPTAGEMMEISIEFADAEHVNHDIMITQNGEEVLNDEGAHHHDGKGMHTTAPLSSSDPVDVTITFQGYGVDDPKTGPIGEEVVFSNVVPEFGTIAMMILAVAIISIVAVTAKSRLSVMPRL